VTLVLPDQDLLHKPFAAGCQILLACCDDRSRYLDGAVVDVDAPRRLVLPEIQFLRVLVDALVDLGSGRDLECRTAVHQQVVLDGRANLL